MKRVLAIMLALILTACFCTGLAYAARDHALAVLPFELKGNHDDEPCVIVIKAVTEGAPMPEDDRVEVKGNGSFTFKDIQFDRVGIYEYIVYQEAGKNADCIYDKTVYHVHITASNGNNDDIIITYTTIAEGDEQKDDGLIFENSYVEKEKPTTPKTGDERHLEQWKMIGEIAAICACALCAALIVVLLSDRKKQQEDQ